jgi:hypothetical protein
LATHPVVDFCSLFHLASLFIKGILLSIIFVLESEMYRLNNNNNKKKKNVIVTAATLVMVATIILVVAAGAVNTAVATTTQSTSFIDETTQ